MSSNPIKYHLVEAEEVDSISIAATQQAAPSQKKTKMKKTKVQWKQLDIDTTIASTGRQQSKKPHDRKDGTKPHAKPNNKHHKNRPRNGRFRTRRQDQKGNYIHGMFVPQTDPKVTAELAKKQIEYYFSPDNLVRDTFLRQNMDCDGYVPVGFVASFHSVAATHQDYPSLLHALKTSSVLEMDEENEKIRTKTNWHTWLWPNQEGGYGLPRYIKLDAQDMSSNQVNHQFVEADAKCATMDEPAPEHEADAPQA